MCNRVTQAIERYRLEIFTDSLFRDLALAEKWAPQWNVAPTNDAAVVVQNGDRKVLEMKTWGIRLPQHGNKSQTCAKAETLSAKWKRALRTRCVLPVIGFMEFRKHDQQALHFCPVGAELLLIAAICSGDHFSIATTEPNAMIAKYHNRMPAVLSPEEVDIWLSEFGPAAAPDILRPISEERLRLEWLHHDVNHSANKAPYKVIAEPPEQTNLFTTDSI